MSQKIDIHGLFIDPETITDLLLQKRISVFYPVFFEIPQTKSLFNRSASSKQHILQFDHQEPYGIILADVEQPDPAGYAVNYKEAIIDKVLKGVGKAGKSIAGHTAEILKIDISGDRHFRILQSGRNIKQISIREIPAKVRLLNGQWIDVFKSSRDFDFQGGNPYAVTDVGANALMITTKEKNYVLYGAGVDASNEEVQSTYSKLADIYNEIQAKHEMSVTESGKKPFLHIPKISSNLPKPDHRKLELPKIKIQSPFLIEKKQDSPPKETLPEPDSSIVPDDKNKPDI